MIVVVVSTHARTHTLANQHHQQQTRPSVTAAKSKSWPCTNITKSMVELRIIINGLLLLLLLLGGFCKEWVVVWELLLCCPPIPPVHFDCIFPLRNQTTSTIVNLDLVAALQTSSAGLCMYACCCCLLYDLHHQSRGHLSRTVPYGRACVS